MNHVVLAPDKFKGCLTANEVAVALANGIRRHRPDTVIVSRPVADGGEGTLNAFTAAGFEEVTGYASGPWGPARRRTRFAVRGDTAVIELAATVGAVRGGSPVIASTRGVGQVIKAALDLGCASIVLAVGGSLSTDGGIGMVQALGAVMRDAQGNALGINDIHDAVRLDLSALDARLADTDFILAADVTNPLLGPAGAAHAFGPQKHATPAQVQLLERRLGRWSELVSEVVGRDASSLPGAGSAGGTGFAAMTLLGARFRRGIDIVCESVGLDAAIADASLVITGEGCLDDQSLNGKAPIGVAEAARPYGVPTVAVAGIIRLDSTQTARAGYAATYALTELEPDAAMAIRHAAELLATIGERIAAVHLCVGEVCTHAVAAVGYDDDHPQPEERK